ncbi:MAG TPA: response regulator [Aggregatilineales bacterium]|nr:response regulator [Anaerolineales bacterium]HRE46933.1 response regulator [Aggregatilineales bacterium]
MMNVIEDPCFVYVEDDTLSREVMHMLLHNRLGYKKFTIFSTAVNLIEQLRELPYHPNVFFLDIQMGPPTGYDVLALLRKEPSYQEATIIAMTANVMSYDVVKLQEAGFDGLIGKPIRQKVFGDLLQRLLGGESVWYVP